MIVGGKRLICAFVMNDDTSSHSSGSAKTSAIGASTRCQGSIRRSLIRSRASRRRWYAPHASADHQQPEREHVGRGRAVAGVEELERLLPDVEHHHRRRLQRPAARGHEHEVEQLQRLERLPHEQEDRHRAERRAARRGGTRPSAARRRSTPPRPARAGCPAAPRGTRRREKPIPLHSPISTITHSAWPGILEEALGRDPDLVEHRVRDPELRVEHEREQHALRGRGHDVGHEHERPVEADEADAPVEHQRDPQPARDAQRHERRRVEQRVLDGAAERRVVEQPLVVVEPDPRARRDEVVVLEAQQQRPAHRQQAEPEDDHDRGQDPQPGGRRLAEAPAGCGRAPARRRRPPADQPPPARTPSLAWTACCERVLRRGALEQHRDERLPHRLGDLRVGRVRSASCARRRARRGTPTARAILSWYVLPRRLLGGALAQRQRARLRDPAARPARAS